MTEETRKRALAVLDDMQSKHADETYTLLCETLRKMLGEDDRDDVEVLERLMRFVGGLSAFAEDAFDPLAAVYFEARKELKGR